MSTASGYFWPCDPRPEETNLSDISGALSKLCRYGGHTTIFYSVAEHCVHVCDAAPYGVKLEALMHDASEAYLVDIPRPIKKVLSQYVEIESRIEEAIALRFGLRYPWPQEVKDIDNAILLDEWKALGNGGKLLMIEGYEPLGIADKIIGWEPPRAQAEFLDRARKYGA
jgi:hypothetical protein